MRCMAHPDLPGTADLTSWLAKQGEALDAPFDLPAETATDPPEAPAATGSAEVALSPGEARMDALFAALYTELKGQARAHMRKENAGHTLSATALTHEAWFRLSAQTRTQWQGRSHFLGMASIMMRRILVNHAIAKQALKREAMLVSMTLAEAEAVAGGASAEVVRVHEALLAFEPVDPRAARVVELKFFGGLENEEIAEVMGLSLATVKRDWSLARAWLHRELQT
jgi:RNA polymerase sigma factor (TIGR02999 family)